MNSMDNKKSQAAHIINKALGAGLGPGELGILMASAGSGKTACLTLIALEQLLHGSPVLHVCVGEKVESVKVWYQEILKNLHNAQPTTDYKKCLQRVEPMRFILAYSHDVFSPERLEQSVQNLKGQAQFHPTLVVIDGLDFDRVTRPTIEALQQLAQRLGLPMWFSARTHRHITTTNEQGIPYPCDTLDDLFHAVILLESGTQGTRLVVLKHHDQYKPAHMPVLLNPQTFLLASG
jgi:hypothetical protein